MTNIILQHYTGQLGELEKESVINMTAYAQSVGAHYQLVTGQVFDPNFTTPIQKIYMLDKAWDTYDTVVMLDIDMFATTNTTENVFNVPGVGLHEATQTRLHKQLARTYPNISSINTPYWGGAIYKLDRETRQRLRRPLEDGDVQWMQQYNRRYHWGDEGIVHTLAMKTGYNPIQPYMDKKWCQCSFLPHPENAGFIHIRTKVKPSGPKRDKIDNLRALQQQGIIA